MKAEINKEGNLVVIAETLTENYALNAWKKGYRHEIFGCYRHNNKNPKGEIINHGVIFQPQPNLYNNIKFKAIEEVLSFMEKSGQDLTNNAIAAAKTHYEIYPRD